jgi:hypothetical protein
VPPRGLGLRVELDRGTVGTLGVDPRADPVALAVLGVPRADLQSVLAQTCDELALVPTRPSTRPHDPLKPLPARPLRVLAPSLGLRGHNECQRSRDPVRRQWAGVTITAAGLAVIGLTATSERPQRSSLAALIVAETAILAIGVGLVRISTPPRRRAPRRGTPARDRGRRAVWGL